MSSDASRRQLARLERVQTDRAVRAGGWLLLAVLWVIAALPGDGAQLSPPALVPAVVAGLLCAWELRRWLERGRHISPVSTQPPVLSAEQRSRVRELVAGSRDSVPAIRFVRQQTGCGLVAAKRAVDDAAGSASAR